MVSNSIFQYVFNDNYLTKGFYQYGLSVAVVLQVIVFAVIGPLGDFGKYTRKLIWMSSSIFGSLLTMGFISIYSGEVYWLATILAILSSVSFGLSTVLYNSFLPLLINHHPQLIIDQSNEKLREKLTSKISTYGFIAAYSSAFLLVCVNILLLVVMNNSWLATRINLMSAGCWWLVFSLISFLLVKSRPSENQITKNILFSGIKKTWNTLKKAKKLPFTFLHLSAAFLYQDAMVSTGTAVYILFFSD